MTAITTTTTARQATSTPTRQSPYVLTYNVKLVDTRMQSVVRYLQQQQQQQQANEQGGAL